MSGRAPAAIPVSLITGFLGSGKTTLLTRLLHLPEMADTAVIINEFGEIGLDHQLVAADEGDVVLMKSGCLCCTIRNSLAETLCSLYERRAQNGIVQFSRVLIETTGLADPAPILQILMDDPFIRGRFALASVVTTVDAVLGEGQLDEHVESVKQAAVADRLILTKTDLASPDALERLRKRLARLNPGAPVIATVHGAGVGAQMLFDTGLYDPEGKSADVLRWLHAEAYAATGDEPGHLHHHDLNRHDARIRACCLVYEQPIDWRYFSPNLAALVSRHAEKLLRIKGILNVAGEPLPVVIHGVQHLFQRTLLPAWPDADRRSRLVLVTRDLDRSFLSDWLRTDRLSGAPPA